MLLGMSGTLLRLEEDVFSYILMTRLYMEG